MIEIYTDGSASKNRAGWGFLILVDGEKVYENSGVSKDATNQQMELMAAAQACLYIHNSKWDNKNQVITIYSDSAYLINCYQDKWYLNWLNNGWKNSKGEPVANEFLWKCLIKFFDNPRYEFEKVKGHSGHIYNERADALATGKAKPIDESDLTTNKNYDTIYIKLSEILLNYSTKKFDTKHTIESIISLMNDNGAYLYKN